MLALFAMVISLLTATQTPATAIGNLYDPQTGNGDVACGSSGYFVVANNVLTEDIGCAGSVSIPEGVLSVSQNAFSFSTNPNVTSLSIANTVTTIGARAFADLQNLTSLNLGTGVTTIGESAFRGLTNLTTLVIPNSVTAMGNHAFSNANNLTSLTIGTGLTTISQSAFEGAWILEELVIPQTVTEIGESAFAYLFRLNSLVIPNDVTVIRTNAFYAATSMTSLTIPNSVTTVGTNAFYAVDLDTLTLTLCKTLDLSTAGIPNDFPRACGITAPQAPASVTATLTGITTASIEFEAPASNGGAPITRYIATSSPGGLTGTIRQSGSGSIEVSGLSSGTAYTFSVVARNLVGNSQSTTSTSITTPTVPDAPESVTATIIDPTTVRIAFTAADSGGSPITRYTATSSPGGLTRSISQSGSGTIDIEGLVSGTNYTFTVKARNAVGDSTASSPSNQVTGPTAPGPPTNVSATVVSGTTVRVSFTAPASNGGLPITEYTAIASSGGFSNTITQSGSGSITLVGLDPNSDYTFTVIARNDVGDSTPSLSSTSITTPNVPSPPISVSAIRWSATTADIEFVIPAINSTETVTAYTAISTPGGLTWSTTSPTRRYIEVTGLTAGVTYAFNVYATNAVGDSGLSPISNALIGTEYSRSTGNGDVECKTLGSTTGEGYFTVANNIVTSSSNCQGLVEIPEGVTAIANSVFEDSSGIASVLIPDTVTTIGSDAFRNIRALTNVSFGDGLQSIGSSAFRNSISMTSITLSNSIITIGSSAFRGMGSLTSLYIGDGVTTIGTSAFRGLSVLTSLYIGQSVQSIGANAFRDAVLLTSLQFPNSLTTIGNAAFSEANRLTSITFGTGLTSIGDDAFEVTTNLTSLTIPEGVTTIGGYAFWNTGLVSLRLPNSLSNVGADAFLSADALGAINYCGNRYENEDFVEWGVDTDNVEISCTPPVITPPPSSVFVAQNPIPYLRTLTTPKNNLKDGKLICTPGTYNAGFTLNGVVQGSSTSLFTPTTFTYNLIINGIAQISLTVTSTNPSNSWDMPSTTSGTLITCSVTVTANGVTNTDRSSDNAAAISAALVTQSNALATANTDYSATLNANAKAYQKALVDNRAQWRKEITAIRASYYDVLARINSESSSRKMIADKSTALKIMIAAQKKSAADYKASQPAAVSAREAANKAALDAKTAAIAKANAIYGTFIESIGYGVLIP